MSQKKHSEEVNEEIKELVIARLETLNEGSKIILMDLNKPITVKDMLEEVKNDTNLGKRIVEVQFKLIQNLSRGEI